MDRHVDVIGILWIVSGALGLLIAFFVFSFFWGISFIPDIEYEGAAILRLIATWGAAFLAILSVPDIIAGIGLMKRREWARILTLVLSFLNLINFPFGTALGIFSIIVLLNEETTRVFNP